MKKAHKQPAGHKMMSGTGTGHYGKPAKDGNAETAGAHGGHSPAHVGKGGGSGHYSKRVHQTANKKHEGNAMLTGSGAHGRNHQAVGHAQTFMQKMVANKSRIIRGE